MDPLNLPDYSEILESIQDGLVVVDEKLRYLYLNKQAEKLIHKPSKTLIGKKFTDAFPNHNLNISGLIKKVKKSWKEKKVATLEIYFKPLNKWYSLIIYPLNNKFSIIFRDITQEKNLRKDLQNSKELLDVIFKHVSDGIVIQSPTGKIIYANEAAAVMSGFATVDSMVDAPLSTLPSHYDIFNEYKKPLSWKDSPGELVLKGKKESVDTVLCFVHKKTKEEIWIDIKTAQIYSNPLQKSGAVSIFHDITVLKRLEQQKDNFISLISHELKTPLTSIKVFLQLLQKQSTKSNQPAITNIVTKVSNNTEKLIKLIQSLLDVSRIQEGKLVLQKKSFSLPSLLNEVREDIQPITNHPISITVKKDTIVFADRERILQVLINLLTNSIKYSKDSKKIIINSIEKNNEVIISVKDFGSGIPRKDKYEIFKRFYQSHKHATFPGLGLGLYISSEIVTQHGGKIWVESKKGKGSIFYFSLPLKKKSTLHTR